MQQAVGSFKRLFKYDEDTSDYSFAHLSDTQTNMQVCTLCRHVEIDFFTPT